MENELSPDLKYDEALQELESIVGMLERKEIKIDELASKVRRAKQLVDFCRSKLSETEEEITKIMDIDEN